MEILVYIATGPYPEDLTVRVMSWDTRFCDFVGMTDHPITLAK